VRPGRPGSGAVPGAPGRRARGLAGAGRRGDRRDGRWDDRRNDRGGRLRRRPPRRRGAVRGRLPRRGVVTYASWPLSAARRVVSAVMLPAVLPVLRSARSVAAVDVVGGLLLDPVDVVGVPVAGALVDHVPGPFHTLAGLVGVLAEHLLHLVDDGHWRSPRIPRLAGGVPRSAGPVQSDHTRSIATIKPVTSQNAPGTASPAPRPSAPAVVAVVRATAAGKSDLAVELALRLGGEAVNADSMQRYRGMDIGTAKLTREEMRGVPHHLLDVWDVTETASVAEYQRLSAEAIAGIRARGRVPVLVGGSGLYVRAALDHMDFPGTDPAVRARLEGELAQAGPAALHERLRAVDPVAAEAILPSNGRRIVRALE